MIFKGKVFDLVDEKGARARKLGWAPEPGWKRLVVGIDVEKCSKDYSLFVRSFNSFARVVMRLFGRKKEDMKYGATGMLLGL